MDGVYFLRALSIKEGAPPAPEEGEAFYRWWVQYHDSTRREQEVRKFFQWAAGVPLPASAHDFGFGSFLVPEKELTDFYEAFKQRYQNQENKWSGGWISELTIDGLPDRLTGIAVHKGAKEIALITRDSDEDGNRSFYHLVFDLKQGYVSLVVDEEYGREPGESR